MDREIPLEREIEEPTNSLAEGTHHKSIFDLPTEIITHIVSFLSLQGKRSSPAQYFVIAVMFRCVQTGSHLSRRILHHP